MVKKIFVVGVVLVSIVIFAGCARRPSIQSDLVPRLEAIEIRLDNLEAALKELEPEVTKANENDAILHENMEMLYEEVDELRAKMGMPLSKPRRTLIK